MVWWIPLAILLSWNLAGIFFRPTAAAVVTLPYSIFIEQVKHDNVGVVRIVGSKIAGTFMQPVRWPVALQSDATKIPSTAMTPTDEKPSATLTNAKKTAKDSGAANASPGKPAAARKSDPASTPSSSTSSIKKTEHKNTVESSVKSIFNSIFNVKKAPPASDAAAEPLRKPPAGWPLSNNDSKLTPADYEAFMTIFPESIGDPQLLPLLEAHGVQITADQPHKPWLFTLLMNILPLALLLGYFWWMGQRAMKQQASIFGSHKNPARRFDSSQPEASFEDVAGAESAKQQLQEEVDFLRHPEKYQALGARIPRGVLLTGPPGTGKTLLARAVAGEADVPFFSISGSEFVEMFVGMGANHVREVFKQAKEAAPSILFIDELDAVARRRGAGVGMVNDEREQTLNQLLVEMDGFDAREKVIVIAATNRPDVLDPAMLRPGRFDRQVVVDLPDVNGREGILRIHSRKIQLAENVDLKSVAGITIGMSGAQLANLCNEAALLAAGQGRGKVSQEDFETALDKLVLGDIRPLVLDEKTRRVIAYHEGGHALVAWLTPGADTVHKVTIVPHGRALGFTEQRPGADQYNFPRSYLLGRIAVQLAGRSAEELVIGDVTTGAENDLIEATRLARHMVMSWGMSELGLAAYQDSGQDRFLGYELGSGRNHSEHTAARIDQQVELLLEQQHDVVTALLSRERARLDSLAAALLSHEIVDHNQLVELLGPRPEPPGNNTEPAPHNPGHKLDDTRLAACSEGQLRCSRAQADEHT